MKKYLYLKWVGLGLLNCSLFVFLCVKNQAGSQELNILGHQLSSIQNQLNHDTKPDLSPITQNLKQLEAFVQQLQNKDDHQLGEIFSTEQIAIKKQLDGITDLLRHLYEQRHPVKMVPATQLPFQILSIDSIQEIPVASVSYQYKSRALEKGDSLAGWTVFAIDFSKQSIEFENKNLAHIMIHLEVNHA